jgi:hypothetical protein
MKLPTNQELGAGLRRWREETNHQKTVKIMAEKLRKSGKNVTMAKIASWERGKSFNYERLVKTVLPTYKIEDVDIFLDYCRVPRVSEIAVIEAIKFLPSLLEIGIESKHVNPDCLGENRTRIDVVSLKARTTSGTPWTRHDGHEFVLVLIGKVACEFAEESDGERTLHTLTKGMAIAFNSGLYHRFLNPFDEDAEVVAAKPTFGGIAGRNSVMPVP